MEKITLKCISVFACCLLLMQLSLAQTPSCDVLLPPFTETFNSNSTTENCWTVVNANADNVTWNLNTTYFQFEGDQTASITKYWNSTSNDDYLISPTIQLDGNQRVKFNYRVVTANSPVDLEVLVSTSGTDISQFTNVLMAQETIDNTVYEERILYLDNYTGPVNIAFRTPPVENNDWTLFLDYITVEDIPSCPSPIALTSSNETDTSATLSWGQAYQETQYELVVQESGLGAPTTTPILVDGTSYQAENLQPGTFYQYFVRSYCSATNTSEWAGPFTFHTDVCAAENMCNYTVTVTSTGVGGNYCILSVTQNDIPLGTLNSNSQVVSQTFPMCDGVDFEMTWNYNYWNSYTESVIITDGYDEIVYEWYLNDAVTIPFVTQTANCYPVACPLPSDMVVLDQQQNSVTIDWVEQGSATSWEVYVVPFGSDAPSNDNTDTVGTIVNAHPYEITGLASGQQYEYYIRSLCGGDDGVSSWTQVSQFQTLIENDDCDTAISLIPSTTPFIEDSYAASLSLATASGQDVSCGDATFANDDVWFEFTATATSHVVYIKNIRENGVGESQNVSHNLNKVIYSGDCDNLQEITCINDLNDDENNYFGGFYTAPNTNYDDILLENLTVGETYKVRVFSNYAVQRNFTFDIAVITPESALTIDQDTYTPEEIVQNILMNSECVAISNVNVVTGITYGNEHNGVAYFEGANTNFNFMNGIVLTTGSALTAAGPKLTMQSNSAYTESGVQMWPGDFDLQDYLADAFGGEEPELYDGTVLEFDFIAYGDHMSFNFIFASEDYGVSQCGYGDGFAFLLTDAQGQTTNLAVLPNTQTPVSVRTIRDSAYNDGCTSENAEYFDHLFDGMMGESRYATSNNFYGSTVPFVAEADLVFGQQYHLKLVIADEGDGNWDSGVFIEGGSFTMNNTLDLGEDILLGSEEAVCEGESIQLSVQDLPEGTQVTWYQDGQVIEGENSTQLEVTTTANYSIGIVLPTADCEQTDEIRVEFNPVAAVSIDGELEICRGDEITLTATVANTADFSNENLIYTWFNEAGEELQTGADNTFMVTEAGAYTVAVVADETLCASEATAIVSPGVCEIPQAISPNGDGLNDTFDLTGLEVSEIKIFNRLGTEVYSRSNYTNEWEGQSNNGNLLPVGTYYYVLKFSDGRDQITGWVYVNY